MTVSQGESGVRLDLYQVPLESWHTELSQYMDRLAAAMANAAATEDGQPSQVNVQVYNIYLILLHLTLFIYAQEMVYSKPSLLTVIHPPKPFSPCPTNDPAAAFQRVKEGMRGHLPTGELHTLTPNYFKNRKKEFIAKHPDMADQYDDILAQLNYSKRSVHIHGNETSVYIVILHKFLCTPLPS